MRVMELGMTEPDGELSIHGGEIGAFKQGIA